MNTSTGRIENPRFVVVVAIAAALLLTACSSSEEKAQNYYADGAKLLSAHNYQTAAIEFRNAIKYKKDMLPAWRGLAESQEATKDWNGLVSSLNTIVELDPKDDATRIKLATFLLAGGAIDQSLKIANAVDDPNGTNVNLLALKAGIYYKLKDQDTAVRDAQAALKIQPDNADAIVILSLVRLQNDPQGALQLLSGLPAKDVDDTRIKLLKLDIYQKLKDNAHVEELLNSLIATNPKNGAFRGQLVRLYISEHRLDDAEKQLRDYASANPENSDAGLDLIKFLYATKGPSAAQQELESRINAGGSTLPYQLALAEFKFDQGKPDESFALLKKLSDSSNAADAVKAKVVTAQLMLRQKDLDGAEKLADGILKDDTHNDDALQLRASIRLNREQLDGAISDLREALNDRPRSTELMIMLATAYERSGSVDLADKEYNEAIKISQFDPRVGLAYVNFLQQHGGADRSYDFLTDLANRQPGNIQVLSRLAQAKLQRQDWAGAEEIAQKIKRMGTNEAAADEILGAALGGEHKLDASIAAFQSAVSAAPSSAQPMYSLVTTLINAKKTDQAIAFLQSVLKDSPNNADALVLLGNVQVIANQPGQAEASYKTAIQKQPHSEIGYRALADYYLRQGKSDAAQQTVTDGLKANPNSAPLELTQAGILESSGHYDDAIAAYQEMLKQQPGSPVIANNLASLLADHRTDKDSLDQAQALIAVLRNSPVPQFKDTVGWVTYRLGDAKAAVPLLNDAVAGMPRNPLVHYHLGMSYVGAGEPTKAADQLKEALNDQPPADLEAKIKTGLKDISTQ
jgi:cellulose synthase operon protein C